MSIEDLKKEKADALYWSGKFAEALRLYLELEEASDQFSEQIYFDVNCSLDYLMHARAKRNMTEFSDNFQAVSHAIRVLPGLLNGTEEVSRFYEGLKKLKFAKFNPSETLQIRLICIGQILAYKIQNLEIADFHGVLKIPFKTIDFRIYHLVNIIANHARTDSIDKLSGFERSESLPLQLRKYLTLKVAELKFQKTIAENGRN